MSETRRLRCGALIKPQRFIPDKFVGSTTKPLVQEILDRYDVDLIASQLDYWRFAPKVDFLLSLEPEWAAPVLGFRRRILGIPTFRPPLTYVLMSDPHIQQWREDYFLRNDLDFILGCYYHSTLRHFARLPPERLVHFPWAVPDAWIADAPTLHHDDFLACYGASGGDAYDVRNWCKEQDFVRSFELSRCEDNAPMKPAEYMRWVGGFDVQVAAGSSDPRFDLATTKYFEIAASGALLFAQETADLPRLGFKHMENCVIFTRDSFVREARAYLANPERYLPVREACLRLVRERHSVSVRADEFDAHLREQLAQRGKL